MIKMIKMIKSSVYYAARLWIRFFPFSIGKDFAWDFTSWRVLNYKTRTKFGSIMVGNTQDIIQKYIYYFGTWEPHISIFISSRLKPGDIFIDIGSNVGYYSLLASNLVGTNGKVVAIEASPKVFDTLQKHIALNDADNIRAICYAVSNERTRLVIHHGESSNIGSTSIVRNFKESFHPDLEIEAAPLGDLLSHEEITKARMIKIDVEGAEWLVIEGMAQIFPLLNDDVEILLEVSPEMLVQFDKTINDLLDILGKYGFYAYIVRNKYNPEEYLYNMPVSRPRRFEGSVESLVDLIFSKKNQERL